jgi:hypothetical protein
MTGKESKTIKLHRRDRGDHREEHFILIFLIKKVTGSKKILFISEAWKKRRIRGDYLELFSNIGRFTTTPNRK